MKTCQDCKIEKTGSAVKDLGCSIEEFKKYIEGLFYNNPNPKDAMTWNNRGLGPGKWQIDHTKALGLFDLSNREEFLIACHYTNMRPMWSEDHVEKTKADTILIKMRRKQRALTYT